MHKELVLDNIRSTLIRLEETLIFGMIERAQFAGNQLIYQAGGISIPDSSLPFMHHLLYEMEKVYAQVRRYTAPDEHPFSGSLPEPYLTPMVYDWPIKKTAININPQILEIYINEIIPLICVKGDDGNYGSSSVCDVHVLQSLSKRIHYGKFVAESKFQKQQELYTDLILKKDSDGIMNLLTDSLVEEKLLQRVEIKASTYGQDPLQKTEKYKIDPKIINKIYKDFIIPLTKKVEVLYLMERLN